jgi:hypothetical protein
MTYARRCAKILEESEEGALNRWAKGRPVHKLIEEVLQ